MCVWIYEKKALIFVSTNNITTMATTREFMRNYWQRELQERIDKRACAWKIRLAQLQLSNYK